MDLEFQCDIAHIKFPPPTTGMDSCQYIKHYCSDYFKSVNFLEIYLCYTNESTLMLIVFSVPFSPCFFLINSTILLYVHAYACTTYY